MSDVDAAGARADAERTGSVPRPGASAPSSSPSPAAAPGDVPVGGTRSASGPDARDGGRDAEASADKPSREKSGGDWFAPRKAPTGPPPGGAPVVSGPSGSAGSPGAPGPSGPSGTGGGSGATPPRPDLPYFSGSPQDAGGAPGSGGPGGPGAAQGPGVRTPGPSGPTTGPVTGVSSLTPDLDRLAGLGGGPAGPHGPGPGGPGGSGPGAPGGPGRSGGPGMPGSGTGGQGMGGPGPGMGGPGGPGGVPPRMSDDTAILTPQSPGPEPGQVSGDTLTSGIPVLTPDFRSSFPDSPMGSGPAGPGAPAHAESPRPASQAAAPAKKGRSKPVLLGVGVVVLCGIAYGAGLLMNHAEVPKGTTVLGVDIGGGTKAEAVSTLESALGKRAQAPLELSVGGRTVKLSPDKAGLSLDSQQTVRSVAGSDYNPVSVIGSLFGAERPADPVIPVDQEKLTVALTDLAGSAGSSNDGTIKFEPNKAVAVPGRTGKALDVNQSMISVRDAYRAQVQTGRPSVVELPMTTSEPTITQAEIDRAMKDFAKPAMSGLITIKAGPKQIQFGPAKSLPQILSMKPVSGRLVEVYDKQAINTLLDGVFDGVMAVKGDGKQHQVNADDVAHAMQSALLGKTPAERTVTIDLGGN